MPNVPDYASQATPEVAPSARVSVDQPASAFGGGDSLDRVTRAASGLAGQAAEVFEAEKKKADEVVALSMNRALSDKATEIQVNTRKMQGKDALNAPGYAKDQWDSTLKDMQESASNDSQRIALQRLQTSHWDSLNKTIQMHVGDQLQKYDESETQGLVDSSRNAAGLNADDDERIAKEIDSQKQALEGWAKRNGIPTDSAQFQDRLTKTLSLTHHDIIQTRLNAGDDQGGKEYFDAHKSEMSAEDIFRAEKAIDDATMLRRGNELWSQVQGMKLADGNPDERRMEAYVNSQDLSERDKNRAWEYVKARAGEAVTQKSKEDAARDRSFFNAVVQARQKGQPMDQALKLINNFTVDPYDSAIKQEWVQKIYAPASVKTDPETYVNLWERIQEGDRGVTKATLGDLLHAEKLSPQDFKTLFEQRYKANTEGADPLVKIQNDRVKALAEEKIPNKNDRAQFMYDFRRATIDKDPDEFMKIATEKLGKAPGSGYVWDMIGGSPTYKLDVKKYDAQSEATQKLYNDLGRTEAQAILQGLSRGGKPWTVKDIEDFSNQFGGYDKIKPGTPAHNAIRSLVKHKELVTPANMNAVLKANPTGVY